jgi:hypothetical protein
VIAWSHDFCAPLQDWTVEAVYIALFGIDAAYHRMVEVVPHKFLKIICKANSGLFSAISNIGMGRSVCY